MSFLLEGSVSDGANGAGSAPGWSIPAAARNSGQRPTRRPCRLVRPATEGCRGRRGRGAVADSRGGEGHRDLKVANEEAQLEIAARPPTPHHPIRGGCRTGDRAFAARVNAGSELRAGLRQAGRCHPDTGRSTTGIHAARPQWRHCWRRRSLSIPRSARPMRCAPG